MMMFSAASSTGNGLVDIQNPGSCVKARQSPSEGGRKSKMLKQTILVAAVAGLVLALAPAAQAGITYDDFSTDPKLATDWTHYAMYGTTGTATWNEGDQDLDLAAVTDNRMSALRRTADSRGANDPVTLTIVSNSASGDSPDWAHVGVMISSTAAPPLLGDTNPCYFFALQTVDGGAEWSYRVKRDSNTAIYTSSSTPAASLTFPIRLDIERNGDDYDFKVDGSTLYTASHYDAATHDTLVYYHVMWGSGANTSMTATVDDFGVPEPATMVLLGLGGVGLVLSRKRK